MTPKLSFIISILFITSLFYSFDNSPKILQICIKFEFKDLNTFSKIYCQGKILIIPLRDTCINIILSEQNNYKISIETPEYVTYLIPIRDDTLKTNHTIFIKAILKNELLKEVTVRPDNYVFMRDDTLIFDVSNVKAKPHGDVSDLLKRIPGIRVGRYGNIDIGGEQIANITVNGRQVFGGNRRITLELIKADAIASLEVVKSKDGSGTLDLNIKLKKDHEDGFYGESSYGLGTLQTESQSLKINNITPKAFTNFFINNSNTSEKILSNSIIQQTNSILAYNEMNRVYSLVSNHLGLFGDLNFKTPSRNFNTPELNNDRGINKSSSMGVSQDVNYKKISLVGFVLAENNKQNLEINKINNNIIGSDLIQRNNQNEFNQRERWQISTAIYGNINLSTYDKFKFFISSQYENSTVDISALSNVKIIEKSLETPYQIVEKKLFSNKNLNQLTSKVAWIHRYKKSGFVTSFLGTYGIDKYSYDNTYINKLKQDSTLLLSNNNKTFENTPLSSFELQFAQSLPISREILFEIKNIYTRESMTKSQEAFRFNSLIKKYTVNIPSLSINDYTILNTQNDFQFNLLLKTGRTNFIAGLDYWYWHTNREETNYKENKLLPTLYWQYKFHHDKSRYLTIFLNNIQLLPSNEYIFPVADSSNINLNRSGNSNLFSFSRWQTGINVMTTYKGVWVRPEVKYVEDINPIQIGYVLNNQNQLSQSFVQLGKVKSISARLNLSNARQYSVGFHISTAFTISEQNTIFMDIVDKVESFSGSTTFGIKLNPSDKIACSLNIQSFYNGYFNKNLTSVRNILDLNVEAELNNRSYFDLNMMMNFNKSSSSEITNSPIINCSYSQFIFKKNNIKLTIKGNNLLDIRRLYESSGNVNIQNEAYYYRMPRFIMLSMTYFWEKWRHSDAGKSN